MERDWSDVETFKKKQKPKKTEKKPKSISVKEKIEMAQVLGINEKYFDRIKHNLSKETYNRWADLLFYAEYFLVMNDYYGVTNSLHQLFEIKENYLDMP